MAAHNDLESRLSTEDEPEELSTLSSSILWKAPQEHIIPVSEVVIIKNVQNVHSVPRARIRTAKASAPSCREVVEDLAQSRVLKECAPSLFLLPHVSVGTGEDASTTSTTHASLYRLLDEKLAIRYIFRTPRRSQHGQLPVRYMLHLFGVGQLTTLASVSSSSHPPAQLIASCPGPVRSLFSRQVLDRCEEYA